MIFSYSGLELLALLLVLELIVETVLVVFFLTLCSRLLQF